MFKRGTIRREGKRHESTPSLRRHIFVGVSICVLVLIFAVSIWYGTRLPAVTIASISVEGGETIQSDTVRTVAQNALDGSYLKLIPYRFTFFYPQDSVAHAITAIPRVKSAVITRDSKNLSVTFTEYVPYALWCTALDDTPRCYFLDETGYAFAPGPRLQGGTLVRHFFEDAGALEKKQVFDPEAFSQMHTFLHRLTGELSLRITDVLYTNDGDVKLSVNGGGELLFRNGESYEVLFTNLASILSSDEFKHIEPGNFKYIDLRFGNKIFVNEKMEPDIPATTTEAAATSTP